MTLPRDEYDAMQEYIKSLEKLCYQMMDAFDEKLGAVVMVRNEQETSYMLNQDWNRGSTSRRAEGRQIHERVEFLSGTVEWEKYFEKHIARYYDDHTKHSEMVQMKALLSSIKTKLVCSSFGTRRGAIDAVVNLLDLEGY